MSYLTFLQLIEDLKEYSQEEIAVIEKAYDLACDLHSGQYRDSGEPYIIHPLSVAFTLAQMRADVNTICAGLLHDVVEDTNISLEEISRLFNKEVATLVDGVTKISFSSKQEERLVNHRKIITSIIQDVRIVIIKLADRLHNMQTLNFKKSVKQQEKSLETMEIYVPLAQYIGAYDIKNELEDLSLKYLKPDKYQEIVDWKLEIEEKSQDILKEMIYKISKLLNDKNINHVVKLWIKNIYGIYQDLEKQKKPVEIHDLLALKLLVETVENCYLTLGLVHSLYRPIDGRFKDYISNQKTNLYQSLHTTVFAPSDWLVQAQIRTFDMEKVNMHGLTAYWELNKGTARDVMQQELRHKMQFYRSLQAIDSMFSENHDFLWIVKNELFSDKIYVYTTEGDYIELPKGSTPIDFAYKIHTEVGNTMIKAIVNEEIVDIDYVLQDKDRVKIVTSKDVVLNKEGWEKIATTPYARRKIREFNRKR
ncbi:MAG: bifunctional (p)ppGpp synthetase/guanosine-3',5'-bis(diphosphate) 3'-pyrophosphohydrolase [Firmicutes bacterium]|nr:bifunctional (p)ppGpp synthetase/guanosine-3',5'-bis(diphosphate) 3'-pyrophosphohydrolase [Bacillota bacterium]